MAAITQLMNLTHFVLTGGVAIAHDLLQAELDSAYLAQTLAVFHSEFRVVFTGVTKTRVFWVLLRSFSKLQKNEALLLVMVRSSGYSSIDADGCFTPACSQR
jgi:hypothetical protein